MGLELLYQLFPSPLNAVRRFEAFFLQSFAYRIDRDIEPFAALQIGYVQRAFGKQVGIAASCSRIVFAFGYEFVYACVLHVVAHVHHDATVFGDAHGRILMVETTQSRMLSQELAVERIDFRDPAVMSGVQACGFGSRFEVLFAGHDRVPQRNAAGAIRERSGNGGDAAGRIGAAGRAGQFEFAETVDTAGIFGGRVHFPYAVFALLDFDNRHALIVELVADLLRRHFTVFDVPVKENVRIFMVGNQQAVRVGAVDGKVSIVVRALTEFVSGIVDHVVERGYDVILIALWQDELIGVGSLNRLEKSAHPIGFETEEMIGRFRSSGCFAFERAQPGRCGRQRGCARSQVGQKFAAVHFLIFDHDFCSLPLDKLDHHQQHRASVSMGC